MSFGAKELVKKKMLEERIFSPLVNKTFEELDLNHSGFLEIEEFTSIINDIYRTLNLPPPSKKYIKDELKRYDANKDGKLSKNEYSEFLQELILNIVELL